MIGKFKRYLKERCPECGKVLEVRTIQDRGIEKGISVIKEKEFIVCSDEDCGYERKAEKRRERRKDEE